MSWSNWILGHGETKDELCDAVEKWWRKANLCVNEIITFLPQMQLDEWFCWKSIKLITVVILYSFDPLHKCHAHSKKKNGTRENGYWCQLATVIISHFFLLICGYALTPRNSNLARLQIKLSPHSILVI